MRHTADPGKRYEGGYRFSAGEGCLRQGGGGGMAHKLPTILMLTLLVLFQPLLTYAQQSEPPAGGVEPSKEMRAQMASVHERMVTCLRSEKSFADCRTEMMKGCQELMGGHGCSMMGMPDQMKMEPQSGDKGGHRHSVMGMPDQMKMGPQSGDKGGHGCSMMGVPDQMKMEPQSGDKKDK
jgi:hypothetical protein